MERSDEIHEHKKSGQLRQRGRNRIKTETDDETTKPHKLVWCYPIPFEGWDEVELYGEPTVWPSPQDLDQRSRMNRLICGTIEPYKLASKFK